MCEVPSTESQPELELACHVARKYTKTGNMGNGRLFHCRRAEKGRREGGVEGLVEEGGSVYAGQKRESVRMNKVGWK